MLLLLFFSLITRHFILGICGHILQTFTPCQKPPIVIFSLQTYSWSPIISVPNICYHNLTPQKHCKTPSRQKPSQTLGGGWQQAGGRRFVSSLISTYRSGRRMASNSLKHQYKSLPVPPLLLLLSRLLKSQVLT